MVIIKNKVPVGAYREIGTYLKKKSLVESVRSYRFVLIFLSIILLSLIFNKESTINSIGMLSSIFGALLLAVNYLLSDKTIFKMCCDTNNDYNSKFKEKIDGLIIQRRNAVLGLILLFLGIILQNYQIATDRGLIIVIFALSTFYVSIVLIKMSFIGPVQY